MGRLLVDGDALRVPGEEQFVMDGWIELAPFEQLLGMHIVEARNGCAVLTMPFTVKLSQGGGFMHGGALTALADTAAAMAVKTCLPRSTPFATRDLNMRFRAPVRLGTVTATARAQQVDERRFTILVSLTDCGDVRVAEFSADFRLLRSTTL
jgi:uncharacterized protein (TIGR00369 family)